MTRPTIPDQSYIVYSRLGKWSVFSEDAQTDIDDAADDYMDKRYASREATVFQCFGGTMLVDVTDEIERHLRARFDARGDEEDTLPRWLYPELDARDACEQYWIEQSQDLRGHLEAAE